MAPFQAYLFSGVIAASRVTSHVDGVLKPRSQREYLTFQRGSQKLFYMCEPIDNFDKHVLGGSLDRRGWILQAQALGRLQTSHSAAIDPSLLHEHVRHGAFDPMNGPHIWMMASQKGW